MATETVATYPYAGTLVVKECITCGIIYGIPRGLYDAARKDPKVTLYCAAGHSMHYPIEASRITLLEQELERSQDALASNRAHLARAEASRSALRGVVTRERNRIARGLCPRCNREFADVAKHFRMLHQGFADEDPEASDAPTP